MGIQRPIQNCPYGYDDDGTCGHSENLTPECHLQTCPLYDSYGNLRVSQDLASKLEVILANSFTPVKDYSDNAVRQHWKYANCEHLEERDRIFYVSGYLEGRSTESSNLRACLKSIVGELTDKNGMHLSEARRDA